MSNEQYAVSLTFGRNVRDEPMSTKDWSLFQIRASTDLNNTFEDRVEFVDVHQGVGVWEGISEQSCKITAIINGAVTADETTKLRVAAADLAARFQQDAVALSVGQSFLITA